MECPPSGRTEEVSLCFSLLMTTFTDAKTIRFGYEFDALGRRLDERRDLAGAMASRITRATS